MKKISVLLVCIIISFFANKLFAADSEIGVLFGSMLSNHGLIYKFGGDKNKLRVHSTFYEVRKTENNNLQSEQIDYNVNRYSNLTVGDEFHFQLGETIDYFAGIEFGASILNITDSSNTLYGIDISEEYNLFVNAVLGITLRLHDNIVFGLEATPGVRYEIEVIKYKRFDIGIIELNKSSRFSYSTSLMPKIYFAIVF